MHRVEDRVGIMEMWKTPWRKRFFRRAKHRYSMWQATWDILVNVGISGYTAPVL